MRALDTQCFTQQNVIVVFVQEIRKLAKNPLVRQSTSCKEVLARVLSEAAILRARPPEEISILMRAGVQAPPVNGGMSYICYCARYTAAPFGGD